MKWRSESILTFRGALYTHKLCPVASCTSELPWAGVSATLWYTLPEFTVLANKVCDTPALIISLEVFTRTSVLAGHGITLIDVRSAVKTLGKTIIATLTILIIVTIQ